MLGIYAFYKLHTAKLSHHGRNCGRCSTDGVVLVPAWLLIVCLSHSAEDLAPVLPSSYAYHRVFALGQRKTAGLLGQTRIVADVNIHGGTIDHATACCVRLVPVHVEMEGVSLGRCTRVAVPAVLDTNLQTMFLAMTCGAMSVRFLCTSP